MDTLKSTFIHLINKYSDNNQICNELWAEIELHYSDKKRYYHTLQHLDNLLTQLIDIQSDIRDWDTMLFSLYYHDIIYDVTLSDNEERSAELAVKRLKQLDVSSSQTELCRQQILATKSHVQSTSSDTNYFTDADLSVLGQDWAGYASYFRNIREEYSVYPDPVYQAGRKKVLHHFLGMERIFKTAYFYNKFEVQARENIQKEFELL